MGADRDWKADALALLAALVPAGGPLRPLKVPLEVDECKWFVQGWEAGLYPVSTCPDRGVKGVCHPDRLDHFRTTSLHDRHLLTRWSEGPWGLSREYVTHLAAFARAILDFGYEAEGSLLSHYGRYRRDLITKRLGGTYEIDAAFPDPAADSPWLLIEAKADPRDIGRWAVAIDDGATATELIGVGFKEVEYVLELAPKHLWLVGPGTIDPAAHVWATTIRDSDATFERVPAVPSPVQCDGFR